MKTDLIKFSVVVPSYNQGAYIGRTLQSLLDQHYDALEIIVMDGGSTDGSVEVIKRFAPHIAYWQSQKDGGQSAAINAGFRRATGDFVTWLNSDDILLPGTLAYVNRLAHRHPDTRCYLGNVIWMDKTERVLRAFRVERYSRHFASKGLFSNGGPSAFIRKDLLEDYGYLREDFNYMMDTELWLRWASHNEPFVRINKFCWGLRLHEAAKMSGHNFAGSELADKKHPSWQKKRWEADTIDEMFKPNTSKIDQLLYKLYKVTDAAILTRFTECLRKGRYVKDLYKGGV